MFGLWSRSLDASTPLIVHSVYQRTCARVLYPCLGSFLLLVCPGDGWSPRLEDAVLHGCIPVIIMDDVQVGVWAGVLGKVLHGCIPVIIMDDVQVGGWVAYVVTDNHIGAWWAGTGTLGSPSRGGTCTAATLHLAVTSCTAPVAPHAMPTTLQTLTRTPRVAHPQGVVLPPRHVSSCCPYPTAGRVREHPGPVQLLPARGPEGYPPPAGHPAGRHPRTGGRHAGQPGQGLAQVRQRIDTSPPPEAAVARRTLSHDYPCCAGRVPPIPLRPAVMDLPLSCTAPVLSSVPTSSPPRTIPSLPPATLAYAVRGHANEHQGSLLSL